MNLKKRKWLWISIGSLLLLIILASVFKGGSKETKVATDKVGKRTITEVVSVNGKIQPESEVKISADVSGEIIDMQVREGDSVRTGQLLCRINPELYETTLSQLSANLSNSRASLAGAEAQRARVAAGLMQAQSIYERQKKLYDQKVVSEQEFENARIAWEMARADVNATDKNILATQYSVQSMAARLEEGRRNLGRTSIFAPASGIVTQMNSEKGERVVGTAQMAGTEIMRISNFNSMEVKVNVNENDVVRIKLGDSADVKVDAYPDRVFRGVVTQIANSAKFNAISQATDQVTNFEVKIHILVESYADLGVGREQPFRPGMTAGVDIRTKSRSNVLSIPISAVTTRNPMKSDAEKKDKEKSGAENALKEEEKATYVFLYNGGKARAVKVKTGVQDIEYFEIIEGLKEGDEVITAPGMAVAKMLSNGEKVKKVDKDKVFDK